jgi:hypothetical protein
MGAQAQQNSGGDSALGAFYCFAISMRDTEVGFAGSRLPPRAAPPLCASFAAADPSAPILVLSVAASPVDNGPATTRWKCR